MEFLAQQQCFLYSDSFGAKRKCLASPLRHSVSPFECICSIKLHFMKSVLRPFRAATVTYLPGIKRPKDRESRLLRRHLTYSLRLALRQVDHHDLPELVSTVSLAPGTVASMEADPKEVKHIILSRVAGRPT